MALKEAYTASLKDMWIFYAVIAAVGFLGSFGIKRNELHKAHEVTKTGLDVQKEGRRMDVEERRRKREGKGVKMKDVEAAVGENVWEKGMDDTGEMVGSGEKKGSKEVEG